MLFVWVHSSKRRDPSSTLQSVEASDIGKNYLHVRDEESRTFPKDYPNLQQWWQQQWLKAAKLAEEQDCQWILRLEDDIIVNRHIRHNVLTWPALRDPDFGLGTVFWMDYWDKDPEIFKTSEHSGEDYRDTPDVEGAQGQVLKTTMVPDLIEASKQAIIDRGFPKHVSFDWSLSRGAHQLGLQIQERSGVPFRTFVHYPSLVNITEASRTTTLSENATPQQWDAHYWANNSFSADWKRWVNARHTSGV